MIVQKHGLSIQVAQGCVVQFPSDIGKNEYEGQSTFEVQIILDRNSAYLMESVVFNERLFHTFNRRKCVWDSERFIGIVNGCSNAPINNQHRFLEAIAKNVESAKREADREAAWDKLKF